MAYDEHLAERVRARLAGRPGLTEKRMFGGIAFMLGGKIAVGVLGAELMVRVGAAAHDEAVRLPGVREFDGGARPMRGWVSVAPEALAADSDLAGWVERGAGIAASIPTG